MNQKFRRFDFDAKSDIAILRFIFSQALYGEATGVYCGLSIYSARSFAALEFYIRQTKQEFSHLKLFASVFRLLQLTPEKPHFSIRFFSAHNYYYPLKVFLEHMLGEKLVLLVFREGILPRMPEGDLRGEKIVQILRMICKDEEEHVAFGISESKRLAASSGRLKRAYYGLFLLTMMSLRITVYFFQKRFSTHFLANELPQFYAELRSEMQKFMEDVGFVPRARFWPGRVIPALFWALAILIRSRFVRFKSHLDKTYIQELGL